MFHGDSIKICNYFFIEKGALSGNMSPLQSDLCHYSFEAIPGTDVAVLNMEYDLLCGMLNLLWHHKILKIHILEWKCLNV